MRHVFTIHNNFCLTAKTQFGPGAALLLVLTLCLLCLPPPTAQSQSSCVQRLSQVYLIFEDNFLAAEPINLTWTVDVQSSIEPLF